MRTKTINKTVLYRRPVSSACPKGAWFGKRHHTSWGNGGWEVFETGKELIALCQTARKAQQLIAEEEEHE